MFKLFNTLTRKEEEFRPIKDKKVGIYVCGPTVYGPDHIGHARTWIFFDWLRRFLLSKKYKVNFVQNITDVGHLLEDAETGEDKIEKEAKEKGKTPKEIANYFEEAYFTDLKKLNILKPDESPRATDHIKEIIDFIIVLIDKGYAYEKDGNVYFEVKKFPAYGKLSNRTVDELLAGARVKKDPLKKNPADFALWLKADESHLQKWPSPWGEGYPGWHIECSVMAAKYLGQPFDIHGSAIEHVFPHHENEIAQSAAFADKPLAKYFLHSGMLLIDGEKMSKSKGNYLTIKDILEKHDPDTVKIAFMVTGWRKPFNWEESAISEANKIREKLVRAKEEAQPIKTGFPTEIENALNNDFSVPQALAVILKNLIKLSRDDFKYIEDVFGLNLRSDFKLTKQQEKMVKDREEARKKGDFEESDRIRKELLKNGVIIEDTLTGTRILPKP